jgi:hypothetical protein
MRSTSFLRGLFGARPQGEADTASEPETREERRRPAVRCNGCNIWTPKLVYLSNGGHYCEHCALEVHAWSRARPSGKRFDDLPPLAERENYGSADR